MFQPQPRADLVRIGSDYGGWWVPSTLLGPHSVVYLAGAGEDISFDLGLMERYGCEVVSVDPTPRAIAYVGRHAPAEVYHFVSVGLGGSNRIERFYAPANPEHVSHSITNLQETTDFFEAELRTLDGLMAEFGHETVDLLKIDIEGAEYEVLDHLMERGLLPKVLCIEFDQPAPARRTWRYVARLRSVGYRVSKVERFNVTLVQS